MLIAKYTRQIFRISMACCGQHTNSLKDEKSPYLLQHATNPVDWMPWGAAAFDKAKKEEKMIFLSVGYSTCHWCHVMEKESFENPEIGKLMNDNFVSIKVDREERPDVDRLYMSFVQATTGSGGWPMSVWLTPDLRPVVGGTYFPPDDRYYGRPGFATILKHIAEQWRQKRNDVEGQAEALAAALQQASRADSGGAASSSLPSMQSIDTCHELIASSFDATWGGFGKAPKFPQGVNFDFMVRYAFWKTPNVGALAASKPVAMVAATLKAMAKGGIHDQISQGFHRYSTDRRWHVPHFEKMLYDQAQLAVAYAEMYQITKEKFYAHIVNDILTYVERDLGHPEGGFYSAEDADSLPTADAKEKKEGAFCVWTDAEIRKILGEKLPDHPELTLADIFCFHYNVKPDGNVDPMQDPHDELTKQNVLIVLGSLEETAKHFRMASVDEAERVLALARERLFDVRQHRPRPHLDTKILTSWNGLMISAYAKAGRILNEERFVKRAVKAAEFVRKHLTTPDGHLLRSVYADEKRDVVQLSAPIDGFADDYAFFVGALLDLYEATFDVAWLAFAERLQEKMNELFWDTQHYGYFTSKAGDRSIIFRQKEDQDGAEPSANSVASLNLMRLHLMLGGDAYRERARQTMSAFGKRLNKIPIILPKMLCALMLDLRPPVHIVIAGSLANSDTRQLLDVADSVFLPNMSLVVLNEKNDSFDFFAQRCPHMKAIKTVEGKATAYVCKNLVCGEPLTEAAKLREQLLGTR